MIDAILEQYDRDRSLYESFTRRVNGLIVEILRENDIRVHSVTSRVKDRTSLTKKMSRPDSPYAQLSDITDIAGVRITTYLQDDVERVARVIEQEFEVDQKNSGDKGALLDPDRFGYLSLHHVVSLSRARCLLIEYRRFPHLKAEIQTRSILQHAWAEIEHDLGYKSTQEVPRSIRRRFSRLAGLLELADQEFIDIKNELETYESSVPGKIESEPQLVEIDNLSLTAFLTRSELVNKLDKQIGSFCGARIRFNKELVPTHVVRLKFLQIKTIRELEDNLRNESDLLLAFAEKWLKGTKHSVLNTGISVFYLGYALIAKTQDTNYIENYLNTVRLVRVGLKERIMETFAAIHSSKARKT